jgi:hypothetical protein
MASSVNRMIYVMVAELVYLAKEIPAVMDTTLRKPMPSAINLEL